MMCECECDDGDDDGSGNVVIGDGVGGRCKGKEAERRRERKRKEASHIAHPPHWPATGRGSRQEPRTTSGLVALQAAGTMAAASPRTDHTPCCWGLAAQRAGSRWLAGDLGWDPLYFLQGVQWARSRYLHGRRGIGRVLEYEQGHMSPTRRRPTRSVQGVEILGTYPFETSSINQGIKPSELRIVKIHPSARTRKLSNAAAAPDYRRVFSGSSNTS